MTANSYLIWADKLCFHLFIFLLNSGEHERIDIKFKANWEEEKGVNSWACLEAAMEFDLRNKHWKCRNASGWFDSLPCFHGWECRLKESPLKYWCMTEFTFLASAWAASWPRILVLVCKMEELRVSTSLTTLWSAFKIPNSWLKTSFLFALGCTLRPWEASYRVYKQAHP